MGERRVVVTGLGAITAIGNDAPSYWDALVKGKSGVAEVTRFDTEGFDVRIAADISIRCADHEVVVAVVVDITGRGYR